MPPPPSSSFLFTITLIAATAGAAYSQPDNNNNCNNTFSCGAITNITYPFTGGNRPSHCGPPEFQLTCRNATIVELTHNQLTYRVLNLDQANNTLVLSRSDLYNDTCPSEYRNTTLNSTVFNNNVQENEQLSLLYGCNTTAAMSSTNLTNRFVCNSTDAYYLVGQVPDDPIMVTSCDVRISVPVLRSAGDLLVSSQLSLGETLVQGFSVEYRVPMCGDGPCSYAVTVPPGSTTLTGSRNGLSNRHKYAILGASLGSSIVILFIIVALYLTKRGKSNDPDMEKLENYILNHGSLALKRYTYTEVKKITRSFTDKLGQGGFGSVYKGTLPDGRLVAIKVLTDTNNDSEDFLNEVASISRTSHVNIVNLLGFCYEKKCRALVYEFMPNKSLDKFMCRSGSLDTDSRLGLDKLYEIAVGVARGLEYLHRGCNTRIVHFDIKPQNILLDEDFCPKIADFGLAKLCKKQQSVLSFIGTRGTVGYIAPEVFSRNFGAVSHKSDVYSFGMMVLEMVGARKDDGIATQGSSESYFPDKFYEQGVLYKTKKLFDETMSEEAEETTRKMYLVGFWCIQTVPSDRPSMNKVLEMLEGSVQSIQVPPKPFLASPVLSGRQFSSSFLGTEYTTE